MDALLLDLQKVSEQLLPIIGAVALIFVCILLKRAAEFVEELTKTVKDLKPTIQKVDESMEKIQGPLDTAVKLCKTVDNVHEKTTTSMDKLSDLFAEYFEKIKAFVMDMFGSFNNDTMQDLDDVEEANFETHEEACDCEEVKKGDETDE